MALRLPVCSLLAACALAVSGCATTPDPTEPGSTRAGETGDIDDLDDGQLRRPVRANRAVPAPRVAPRVAPSQRVSPVREARMQRLPRGRRIDLNVKNADLHNLFRFLADVGGVNIVVAPDVAGQVTLRLRNVRWDRALLAICKAHRLDVERDGSIVLIRKL